MPAWCQKQPSGLNGGLGRQRLTGPLSLESFCLEVCCTARKYPKVNETIDKTPQGSDRAPDG